MNQQLLARIKQCPNLPSLPAIAMQVLDLAQKVDADIAEIARIICKDPALSTKILRTVNSSFYARSQNVSTISHALVILGLQSVKTLVLGFSLVTNLTGSAGKGFKHLNYWKRSIYAATAARSIAARIGLVQQEEAFLAGLLQDIGMLVLDQVLGDEYGVIHSKLASHSELPAAEMSALEVTHAEVGGILAMQWKLPPLLTTPIIHHHSLEAVADPALRKLCELVRLGGRCADVFVDGNAAAAIAEVRALCKSQYDMPEADADALLNEIGARTREVASLFEINMGAGCDNYESILKRANEALVEITLQSQLQATVLQKEASTLHQQNQLLQVQATTDALTGLNNRAHFDELLGELFAQAQQKSQALALLMLDIDKFKSVNDSHGHPAGDRVLKAVARLLMTALRPDDRAFRYGGEEMAMILPVTSRAAAAAIAESIRRAIASTPVPCGAAKLPITVSIGVAAADAGGPLKEGAHLVKAADLAVCAAKRSGRNCVRVFSPAKPSAAA